MKRSFEAQEKQSVTSQDSDVQYNDCKISRPFSENKAEKASTLLIAGSRSITIYSISSATRSKYPPDKKPHHCPIDSTPQVKDILLLHSKPQP